MIAEKILGGKLPICWQFRCLRGGVVETGGDQRRQDTPLSKTVAARVACVSHCPVSRCDLVALPACCPVDANPKKKNLLSFTHPSLEPSPQ